MGPVSRALQSGHLRLIPNKEPRLAEKAPLSTWETRSFSWKEDPIIGKDDGKNHRKRGPMIHHTRITTTSPPAQRGREEGKQREEEGQGGRRVWVGARRGLGQRESSFPDHGWMVIRCCPLRSAECNSIPLLSVVATSDSDNSHCDDVVGELSSINF
jgi:hypothetical protein